MKKDQTPDKHGLTAEDYALADRAESVSLLNNVITLRRFDSIEALVASCSSIPPDRRGWYENKLQVAFGENVEAAQAFLYQIQ